MYSPTLGRWVQQDPAGYVDGVSLYGYAKSKPVAMADPLGLASTRPTSQPATQASSWAYQLDAGPWRLHDREVSYEIRLRIVIPPQAQWPQGASQAWQTNDWIRVLVDRQGHVSSSRGTVLDIVDLDKAFQLPDGTRYYPDTLGWIQPGDYCFAMEVVAKTVGFDSGRFDPRLQTGSFDHPAPEFIGTLRTMRGPTSTLVTAYVYFNKKNCMDCNPLGQAIEALGLPDVREYLNVPGVGHFTGP